MLKPQEMWQWYDHAATKEISLLDGQSWPELAKKNAKLYTFYQIGLKLFNHTIHKSHHIRVKATEVTSQKLQKVRIESQQAYKAICF